MDVDNKIYPSENISMKEYTTMHVGGSARYFVEAKSIEDILSALKFAKKNDLKVLVLGGGSNTIFSDAGFCGLVIKISISGVEKVFEDESCVHYKVSAGESWDSFVRFLVENHLYGLENLSHVPGLVGASVVQNIGCYGQEVSSCVVSVDVIDINTFDQIVFRNKDMNFGYRRSRLNRQDKGRFIVTEVTFALRKQGQLVMKYKDIQDYFVGNPNIQPNLLTLRKAIISIRNRKFPFPDSPKNGSSGSFWNAESINEKKYESITRILDEKGFHEKALEMRQKKDVFRVSQGYKVPYGLFIEVLGLKGKVVGGAKILETHAGVINNFTGEATASDVYNLSKEVIETVYKEFGVKINVEPELIGKFE
ncbi:MAG: UDP-N-acetylmuramate dehydrogenase [Patescibacteria group bacterium]